MSNQTQVIEKITGGSAILYGTASRAISASYAPGGSVGTDISVNTVTASVSIKTPYVEFTSGSNPAYKQGLLFYDTSSYTLSHYNENSQMTVNLGQESIIRIFNSSSNAMANGAVVYLSGSYNNYPNAWLAQADNSDRFDIGGVATTTIPAFSYGYLTTSGRVNGLSLNYPVGSTLWLSQTQSGSYQTTLPTGAAERSQVGILVSSGSGASTLVVDMHPAAYSSLAAPIKGYIQLPVQMAKLPATSSARIDASENNYRLLYSATLNQSASWQFLMPSNYLSKPTASLVYSMNTLQSGTNAVIWQVSCCNTQPTEDSNVLTLGNNIFTSSLTNNQGAGLPTVAMIPLTNNDNITASNFYYMRVERLASAAADTATNDAELLGLAFEYTAI